MSLTPEQKKTVAEWMEDEGWQEEFDYFVDNKRQIMVNFSLNDAALCVVKMLKNNGTYWHFWLTVEAIWVDDENTFYGGSEENRGSAISRWLMSMESGEAYNFFAAMAAWIEEEK